MADSDGGVPPAGSRWTDIFHQYNADDILFKSRCPQIETINDNSNTHERATPLCTCEAALLPGLPLLVDIHESRVVFVHRSAAEFVQSSETCLGLFQTPDIETDETFSRLANCIVASAIMGGNGVICGGGWSRLQCPHMASILARIELIVASGEIGNTCPYGWSHHLSPDPLPDILGSPDIIGQAAYHNKRSLVEQVLMKNGQEASSYYKGYLIICAIQGLMSSSWFCRDFGDRWVGYVDLIGWLARHGADILTKHVYFPNNTRDDKNYPFIASPLHLFRLMSLAVTISSRQSLQMRSKFTTLQESLANAFSTDDQDETILIEVALQFEIWQFDDNPLDLDRYCITAIVRSSIKAFGIHHATASIEQRWVKATIP